MNTFLFCLTLIASSYAMYYYLTRNSNNTIVSSKGYRINTNSNPMYYSGRSQKRRKHNMLRISKMRKK